MVNETLNFAMMTSQMLVIMVLMWRVTIVEKSVKAIREYLANVSQYVASTELGKALAKAEAEAQLNIRETDNPMLS